MGESSRPRQSGETEAETVKKLMNWVAKQKTAHIATWLCYGLALLGSVAWYVLNCPRLEPIVVLLALASAGLGSYLQFRVMPMLERSKNLNALVTEIFKNLSIFKEEYSKVPEREVQLSLLPQFHLSAVENVIAQGELDPIADRVLFNSLHDMHDRIRQINSRLAIQESRLMLANLKPTAKEHTYKQIVTGDAMRGLKRTIDSVAQQLQQQKYVSLHGIGKDTIVFSTEDDSE